MLELFSDRLHMRQLSSTDWALFLQLHTDPKVIEYVCDHPAEHSLREKFACRLPEWTPDSDHWLCLVICERHSGQPVGVTGLKMTRNGADAPGAEVGYLLLSQQHGKGYGVESLNSVIAYADESLRLTALQATVTAGNIASCRVLEKCGFSLESRVPNAVRINDQVFEDLIYTRSIAASVGHS
ncbi:GNAT family N-acetyltransferase [Pseudomonas sp. ArH3a]|uniref:GNAT family N-acetyltransferase n=1 Tax=Pseudomonas sp. ArH3a TaxID=2862945 RepID=UPI001F565C29|nr:GNAT family N-acetyltransferase [Pseudomonas sp. ArH3a]UNM22858.1 GNAT family N-acetyltransferase [Pseudomonas sp. ArH3a]